MQDALADDMDAEVAGFDDPGVDRPDGDLECIVPTHRHCPAVEPQVVVDERSHRLVPGEGDPLQIVRLPLVPTGGRDEVDDRRDRSLYHGDRLQPG